MQHAYRSGGIITLLDALPNCMQSGNVETRTLVRINLNAQALYIVDKHQMRTID